MQCHASLESFGGGERQLFARLHRNVSHSDGEPPQVGFVILFHAQAPGEAPWSLQINGSSGEGPLSLHSWQCYGSQQPLALGKQQDAVCHFCRLKIRKLTSAFLQFALYLKLY